MQDISHTYPRGPLTKAPIYLYISLSTAPTLCTSSHNFLIYSPSEATAMISHLTPLHTVIPLQLHFLIHHTLYSPQPVFNHLLLFFPPHIDYLYSLLCSCICLNTKRSMLVSSSNFQPFNNWLKAIHLHLPHPNSTPQQWDFLPFYHILFLSCRFTYHPHQYMRGVKKKRAPTHRNHTKSETGDQCSFAV